MSLIVTLNGANFIIPQTNEVGWGSNLDDYFVAIPAGVLQKTGGLFTLSAETDFGSSFGLKSLYYKSRSSNIAASGILRLANNSDAVAWRNAANSSDLSLTVNTSNQLVFNGTPVQPSSLTSAHIFVGNAPNVPTDVAMSGDIGIDNTGATTIQAGVVTSSKIAAGTIVNSNISASAAIAYSKLALSNSIVNADINSAAAIAITKLAVGTANQILGTNAGASADEWKTLTATANQVSVTHGVGTVTFATPQDIATSSAVRFGSLTLGGALDASSILSLTSTTKGFLPPVMTTTQRNAISSPTDGLIVFDSSLAQLFLRSSSAWTPLSVGGGSGTVASGTINQLAYYAASGTTVSSMSALVMNTNELQITGAVSSAFRGNLTLYDSTAMAAGVGGQLTLGGQDSSAHFTEWASIQVQKANGTTSNQDSNLIIRNRSNANGMVTAIIIDPNQKVGIGTVAPNKRLSIQDSSSASTTPGNNPLIFIGGGNSAVGSISEIGLSYGGSQGDTFAPATIGYQLTSGSGSTKGDLVFCTRNVTTDTAPTEAFRIHADGTSLFTNTGNLGIIVNRTDTKGALIGLQNAGTTKSWVGCEGVLVGSTSMNSCIYAGSGLGINLYVNDTAVAALSISSAGKVSIPNTNLQIGGNQAYPIVQVVTTTTSTTTTTSSSSLVDTNLTVSITPKFSTSKILILATGNIQISSTALGAQCTASLVRNTSTVIVNQQVTYLTQVASVNNVGNVAFAFYDSPATTSATTYKVQISRQISSGSASASFPATGDANITVIEIAQ